MTFHDPAREFEQPDWNDASSVDSAVEALGAAADQESAQEAYDRFLWAVGNNHAGTFFPVVLATLPALERILVEGGAWAQHATIQSLIDLGGSFVPEPGHEVHDGVPVQETLRAFIHGLRPRLVSLAEAGGVPAEGADELIELLDDLS